MMKNIKQSKLKITKQQKRIFITILVILLLVNIGLIIAEAMQKDMTEETQVVSSFGNTPEVSYQVYLKDNALFANPVQPEEIGYFSALIDRIEVTFNNTYQGAKGAEYKGDYTITGEITGWEGGTDSPVPAWTKQFVISPKKIFNTSDEQFVISQNTKIDYNHFNTFVSQIGELTGYNTNYSMKILMTVNYTVTTSEGESKGNLQPAITMPLGESYFKIAKSGVDEMKEHITKTVEIPVPFDYIKTSLYSTLSLLFLVFIFLIRSLAEPSPADMQKKRIKKIFKSHGSRLVAVYDNIITDVLSICDVYSMTDLIKLSDEIERPILYVYQHDHADITGFFLLENEKAYRYQMTDHKDFSTKQKDPEKSEDCSGSEDHSIIITV